MEGVSLSDPQKQKTIIATEALEKETQTNRIDYNSILAMEKCIPRVQGLNEKNLESVKINTFKHVAILYFDINSNFHFQNN